MRMGGYETPKEGEEAGSDNAATGDHIVGMQQELMSYLYKFFHYF